MNPENESKKRFWYGPYEGYESRCKRRIQNDLGVNESATELIISLRSQVVELQAQIHQLGVELSTQVDSQRSRLANYQEGYFEATWIELEFKE